MIIDKQKCHKCVLQLFLEATCVPFESRDRLQIAARHTCSAATHVPGTFHRQICARPAPSILSAQRYQSRLYIHSYIVLYCNYRTIYTKRVMVRFLVRVPRTYDRRKYIVGGADRKVLCTHQSRVESPAPSHELLSHASCPTHIIYIYI